MNYETFSVKVKKWEKCLRKKLYSCFEKIRIKPTSSTKITPYISNLVDKRKSAILKKDFDKREKNEIKIKTYEHDQNFSIMRKKHRRLKDQSKKGVWNLKAKLFPQKKTI